MTKPSKEYVKKHLEQAEEFLEDAKILLDRDRLKSAVDRAYYAMYWAAQGALVDKKIKPPKIHKGLRSMFGKEIVKKGEIDKVYGSIISRAFEARQKSNYELYATFGKGGVEEIVEKAEKFIDKIKELTE